MPGYLAYASGSNHHLILAATHSDSSGRVFMSTQGGNVMMKVEQLTFAAVRHKYIDPVSVTAADTIAEHYWRPFGSSLLGEPV